MSLIGRVYLLVLLAAAPALALQLYKNLEQRAAGEAQVEDEALRLVRFASGELDKLLEGARAFLQAVAAHPAVRSRDPAGCASYLAGMGMPTPPFGGPFLVDAKGEIICAASPPRDAISVADRSYFQRAVATRRFTVGELVDLARRRHAQPTGCPARRLDQRPRRGRRRHGHKRRCIAGLVPGQGLAAGRLDFDRRPHRHDRGPMAQSRAGRPEAERAVPLDARLPPAKARLTGIGPDGVERVGAFVPPAGQPRPAGQRRPFQARRARTAGSGVPARPRPAGCDRRAGIRRRGAGRPSFHPPPGRAAERRSGEAARRRPVGPRRTAGPAFRTRPAGCRVRRDGRCAGGTRARPAAQRGAVSPVRRELARGGLGRGRGHRPDRVYRPGLRCDLATAGGRGPNAARSIGSTPYSSRRPAGR